ncbi:MAG: DUF2892 domain-containing protein [Gemmatimonadaceae bacterium]|jgi:hypothetical protein|nr:DUF2892 domain-containing protein [Gemmatimonadaceae bacterium]
MCSSALIFRIAGLFILASLALGVWVHPAFLFFTAFVGLNLFQTSLTGFCPLERMLGHFGWLGCTPRAQGAERT